MQRSEIRVLADEVIDQIAAGEVVERPASVVKELVENSIDAGARHITIEVENGGKSLIRVIDDGMGMSRAELRLAIRRHATSKLRVLDDLFSLSTMGFRGEALPSIAAVSRMTLISRARAAEPGAWQLTYEGGRLLSDLEVGAPVGTQIEVRDLLFNVPARRKFMKGDATESAHISDRVAKLALANPGVHIRLRGRSRSSTRTTIDAPRTVDAFERVCAVLGTRVGGRLHRAEGSGGGISARAFLAAPELAQSSSRGLQLFVGRRPVRDRGLHHAVAAGYGELIPKGRYPLAVVFVEVPDADVDVNVHPQKLEVRFADPQAVYAVVRGTVERGVAAAPWLSEPAPGSAGGPAVAVKMQIDAGLPPATRAAERLADYAANRRLFAPNARAQARTSLPSRPVRSPIASPRPNPEPTDAGAEPLDEPGFFSGLRFLGQLDLTYLVCEADGELVLIDQHAAHERVEFARLKALHRERRLPVQRLLFPLTVELDDSTRATLSECAEAVAALGFELGDRGDGDSVALESVPAGLRGSGPREVLEKLLAELGELGGSRALDERLDNALATLACHSVVRAGDTLSPREVAVLLESLDAVDVRAHCPHGRPVLLRISTAELARRFGR